MARVVFLVLGTALVVLGASIAGFAAAGSHTVPCQVTRALRDWALGLIVAGGLIIGLALINWGVYHPSNIQLPFVNER